MIPGMWMVDAFPICLFFYSFCSCICKHPYTVRFMLSWLPGGSFQIWAAQAKNLYHQLTQQPFNQAKDCLNHGKMPACFVTDSLTALADWKNAVYKGLTEDIVAGTAASLYSAAVDTVSSFNAISFYMKFWVDIDYCNTFISFPPSTAPPGSTGNGLRRNQDSCGWRPFAYFIWHGIFTLSECNHQGSISI